MSEKTTEYEFLDEDGCTVNVSYTTRTCGCSANNCNLDTLEIHEDGESYKLDISRGELSWFIEGLLVGDYIKKPTEEVR